MALNDETWSLVRNTAKVTGFLGPGGKPHPIPDVEAERIRHQMEEATEHPKLAVLFTIGDTVRVSDGPFASFSGVVEEVDEGKGRLKVSVSIFGRATPSSSSTRRWSGSSVRTGSARSAAQAGRAFRDDEPAGAPSQGALAPPAGGSAAWPRRSWATSSCRCRRARRTRRRRSARRSASAA
jgi:hypothetical protein